MVRRKSREHMHATRPFRAKLYTNNLRIEVAQIASQRKSKYANGDHLLLTATEPAITTTRSVDPSSQVPTVEEAEKAYLIFLSLETEKSNNSRSISYDTKYEFL